MTFSEIAVAADGVKSGAICSRSITINTTRKGVSLGEIQISENEMSSDPDRHSSLSKYRRGSYAGKTTIVPQNGRKEREFSPTNRSIFSHAGHAVMF
jgi:hypothetical protein